MTVSLSGQPAGVDCFQTEYEVVRVLGRGTYGKALLVNRKVDQRTLVVKQVELQDLDKQERAAALNEVAVLSEMDHVNIISYETCFTEGNILHIVMEHATQGDLASLIQKHAAINKPFTEQDIMQWQVFACKLMCKIDL